MGAYVPYGLGLRWPKEFGGRFVNYDSSIETFYIQPTVASNFGSVTIGYGPVFARGSVELNRRENLARVPLGAVPGLTFASLLDDPTEFADTVLSGSSDTGIGHHLGALFTASESVRLGVRFLSSVKLQYTGTATFTAAGTDLRVTKANPLGLPVGLPLDSFVSQVRAVLPNQSVTTELEMPAQFVAGISVRPSPPLTLLADYHWTGWSAFETVTLDFSQALPADETFVQNYRDTSALRIGAELAARPSMRLRVGYAYNQAASPDETVTPLVFESTRNHATAGIGWSLPRGFTVDVAYQHVWHADRRGRIVNPPSGELPTVALNSGWYRSRADLIGLTLTYRR